MIPGGRRFSGMVLVLSFMGPAPVAAQDTGAIPDVVDLPAVLRLVRNSSPRLSLEREGVAGAEANRITAGAYPNPTLSYGLLRPSGGQSSMFDGSRQQQTTIDVPLLIAGQRSARAERAEREIEAARARVASGASSLAAEAGAAFVALLAAQEKRRLVLAANEELARTRAIVAGREATGMASRYDLIRIEVELGGQRAKLEETSAEVSDRSGNLAALLGLKDWRPRASGDLRPLVLTAEVLERPRDRALSGPAAIAARREEAAAQSSVEVARRERWPVPSISAGRAWTSDPYGASNFVGLSVEIPIFDTRQGPLAKAESEARAAALRRTLAEAEVAANLERLANVIAARQTALQRFEQEAWVRLPSLRQMAEDAYRLGRSSIFELLDSTRSRYELSQTHIDLVASLYEAQLRFLAANGDLQRSFDPETEAPARR